MPYIVELEPGVFLASWPGDPGRTLNREYADVFKSVRNAEIALSWARGYRPFEQASIKEEGEEKGLGIIGTG